MGSRPATAGDALVPWAMVSGSAASVPEIRGRIGDSPTAQANGNQRGGTVLAGKTPRSLCAASGLAGCSLVRVGFGRSTHGNWLASAGDSPPGQRNLRAEPRTVG